jgi:hypothetical protein
MIDNLVNQEKISHIALNASSSLRLIEKLIIVMTVGFALKGMIIIVHGQVNVLEERIYGRFICLWYL